MGKWQRAAMLGVLALAIGLGGCTSTPASGPAVAGEPGWEFLTFDPPASFVPRDAAVRSAHEKLDASYVKGLNATPDELRALTAKFVQSFPKLNEPVASIEEKSIPGPVGEIPIAIFTPQGMAGPGGWPVVIYYHGGGWTRGGLDTHGDVVRSICRRAGAVVVLPIYRKAPEQKFPVGFEDCYATLQWVAKNAASFGGDGRRIAVAGDSAGGNLAAAVTIAARDRQGPRIAFQALAYPVTNFAYDTASYHQFSGGYGLTIPAMQRLERWYLARPEDKENPYAAPLKAKDLGNLPPAFIAVGNYDVLRDDGIAYGARLHRASVPTKVVCYQKFAHAFLQDATKYPEANKALDDFCTALRHGLATAR